MAKKNSPDLVNKTKGGKHSRLRADIIVGFLESKGEPVSTKAIAQALGRNSKRGLMETEKLLDQLSEQNRISKLRRHRWVSLKQQTLIEGRVVGHFDGHGFVLPDGGGERIFLSTHDMREVLHNDHVRVRITGKDSRKRRFGQIDSIIERGNTRIIGRFYEERGLYFIVPQDQRISQDVFISPNDIGGESGELKPKAGQVVICEIIQQPSRNFQPTGKLVEILGEYLAPGMEIQIAINEHHIPNEWSPKLLSELDKIPEHVIGDDHLRNSARVDLREINLVTIDGEDARDFDDAVYCESSDVKGADYRLIVAIADVSHYVNEHSELDTEAFQRGNSTYFPREVIPMLPEKLSNGLCSLNPNVDRLCFVCDMHFSKHGQRISYEFYTAVMLSKARLTYTQVAEYLNSGSIDNNIEDNQGGSVDNPRAKAAENTRSAETEIPAPLHESINNLAHLAQLLNAKRCKLGSIDLDIAEPIIIFNQDRKLESVKPRERNVAHRLIEECMLAANICAADTLEQSNVAGVYRAHEVPDEEKVADARQFIRQFGVTLGGGDSPHPKDYAELINKVTEPVAKKVVHHALLRSFKQARYANENLGHFALAFDSYTHFTSPIRRYADLFVHRQLKRLGNNPSAVSDDAREQLALSIADKTSITERRSEKASRDVVQWLKCEFMQHKIGEIFAGTVNSVTDFGMFVELDTYFIEGLVHISSLGDDYYTYNEVERALYGESNSQSYRAGQSVEVKVVRVDLEQRRIDFELKDVAGRTSRKSKGARHAKTSQSSKKSKPNKNKPNKNKSGKASGKSSNKKKKR